jgi:hypothetical protein
MNLKTKRRELQGVVGALGVAFAALGLVGGLYAPTLAIAGAFAIWVVGATLVNVFTDRG